MGLTDSKRSVLYSYAFANGAEGRVADIHSWNHCGSASLPAFSGAIVIKNSQTLETRVHKAVATAFLDYNVGYNGKPIPLSLLVKCIQKDNNFFGSIGSMATLVITAIVRTSERYVILPGEDGGVIANR